MSTAIFTLKFLHVEAGGRYMEDLVAVDSYERSQGGDTAVLNRASERKFVCEGLMQLPDSDSTPNDPSDFWAFWEARSGRADTFLYSALTYQMRVVVLGSLGTGDGSTTAFAFSDGTGLHKHIDESTLLVYDNGALQTITTHYTVSGNNTDPTITFVAAPTNTNPLTVSYSFYMPVRFAMARPRPQFVTMGEEATLTDQEMVKFTVSMEEDSAGARFA